MIIVQQKRSLTSLLSLVHFPNVLAPLQRPILEYISQTYSLFVLVSREFVLDPGAHLPLGSSTYISPPHSSLGKALAAVLQGQSRILLDTVSLAQQPNKLNSPFIYYKKGSLLVS